MKFTLDGRRVQNRAEFMYRLHETTLRQLEATPHTTRRTATATVLEGNILDGTGPAVQARESSGCPEGGTVVKRSPRKKNAIMTAGARRVTLFLYSEWVVRN